MKRALRLFFGGLLLAIVVPIMVGTAIGYARGWPENWRAASWKSSGVLPEAKLTPEASVRILAARTGRWKGIFAVHTWIVMKAKGDAAWVRYDVVGWGKPMSTPSGTGWQISAWGIAGGSLALEEGLELHLLGTTIGIDPKSLAVKLPALGLVGPYYGS